MAKNRFEEIAGGKVKKLKGRPGGERHRRENDSLFLKERVRTRELLADQRLAEDMELVTVRIAIR